jgi:microcystin-dependent protein
MALFATDIVETSSTLGTGTYTLNGPAVAYRGFAAGFVTGDTPYYVVRNAADDKYEINRFGTFVEGTPDTLSRSVYLSSNGNAPVSWIAGDLPLLVYVPAATEMLEALTTTFKATAKSVYLKYGLWFKKDAPAANNDTLMIHNGVVDIPFAVVNNTTNTATNLAALPAGIIMDFAGDVAPGGWVMCYGQALSRTTYAALYAVVLLKYGSPPDGATFLVPDLRGRTTFGKTDMGGTNNPRLTTAFGWVPTTLGSASGSESETTGVTVSSVTVNGTASTSGNGSASTGGRGYGAEYGGQSYTPIGGNTGGESSGVGGLQFGGGGYAAESHTHAQTGNWTHVGDRGVYVDGTYAGTSSGTYTGTCTATGTGSGTTTLQTNTPPGMILNKIISTGGV